MSRKVQGKSKSGAQEKNENMEAVSTVSFEGAHLWSMSLWRSLIFL